MRSSLADKIRQWAKRLKINISALRLVYRDRRTPAYAKILPVIIVGYAFSPIDLIPDFIPVLGFVDDAVVLPALIWLAIRLIPSEVMEDCRKRANISGAAEKPKNYVAAAVILLFWLAILSAAVMAIIRFLHRK